MLGHTKVKGEVGVQKCMLVVCFRLDLDVGVCLCVGGGVCWCVDGGVGLWLVALVCGWKEEGGVWMVDRSRSQNNCERPRYAGISRLSHPTA